MAKTIMISNEVYEELKRRKGSSSFSEIIKESLAESPERKDKRIRTGEDLARFLGVLKDDAEYEKIMKEMKPRWKEWTDRVYKESA